MKDIDILNLAVNIRRRLTTATGAFAESNVDVVDNMIMQEIKKIHSVINPTFEYDGIVELCQKDTDEYGIERD